MPPRKKPTPPPERWTVDITARDLADFLAPVVRRTGKDQWLDDDWLDIFAAMAPETKTSGAA